MAQYLLLTGLLHNMPTAFGEIIQDSSLLSWALMVLRIIMYIFVGLIFPLIFLIGTGGAIVTGIKGLFTYEINSGMIASTAVTLICMTHIAVLIHFFRGLP